MFEVPWEKTQGALRDRGGRAVFISSVPTGEHVAGHTRIGVHQSDPGAPSVFLPEAGPPHISTPDPDGAMHLPADHVHPICFDAAAFTARIPSFLPPGDGPIYIDACSPGTFARLREVFPGTEFRDAAPILGAEFLAAERGPIPVSKAASARRRRFEAAVSDAAIDHWVFRTSEGAGFVSEPATGAIDIDALPITGRLAIDRVTLEELAAIAAARPNLEVVDAGPLLMTAAAPRDPSELAIMRDGYERTEAAISAVLPNLAIGMTEHEARAAFVKAARGVGLGFDHIDHVWRIIPHSRADAPWLRGEWSQSVPWSQLTGDHELALGDHLAIDAGFTADGYVTDFGWTLAVGRDATPAEEKLAARWTEITDRVTDAVRPGTTGADLLAAALRGWEGPSDPWPYGLYVAHGIGFGSVEPPFAGTDLGPAAEAHMALAEGQVLMIEPFVFEEGVGGYRAERCVEVTADGVDVWTKLPVDRWGRAG